MGHLGWYADLTISLYHSSKIVLVFIRTEAFISMKELLENQTSLSLIGVDLSMSSCAFNAIRFNGIEYI